ncbi:MAG: DEAD/DEAH box helicase [Actinomycetota bacterium]|nr:DEAD/DEAH box helicase [Actinomycetota bacterium]
MSIAAVTGPDVSGTDLDRLERTLRDRAVEDQLVALVRQPRRDPTWGELRRPLPDHVRAALGVDRLWSHQATAIDLARDGHSVAVATGTASGKSLCYVAPIVEAASRSVRTASSLLLYPTKALARDQLRTFTELDLPKVAAGAYDGDADGQERAWLRSNANVVLTNPEMLHHGILPHHDKWSTFLGRLRYVVIDEMHVLRGVFGTHVSHILRRLRRLCEHYGSSPVFVFTSATIGEPGQLARALCGLDVTEVTEDGSPASERLLALWNPAAGGRVSGDAAALTAALVDDGRRVITFCRSRRRTELIAADARRRLDGRRDRVRPYRGGYLPEERRAIEDELWDGRLRGVVTTSALELGIDIGGLDASVLCGFPGTFASLWQQIGRAGRDGRASLAALVTGDDQLDQWLARHPDEILTRRPEPAVVNPSNPHLLGPHLECAAAERPLRRGDDRYWPDLDEGIRRLVHDDRLRVRRRMRRGRADPIAVWDGHGWPSHGISLRSSSAGQVKILAADDERVIGTVDADRAPAVVHPGAVYLHQGTAWRVMDLDLDLRCAHVEEALDDERWTRARSEIDLRILEEERSRAVGGARLAIGTVEVSSRVIGYQEIDGRSGDVIGSEPLDLPPSILVTRAVWYTLDPGLIARAGVGVDALPGALHAAEHAAIGILPLFAICDRWDVGGVSTALQADTRLPTIAIHDAYTGGAGIAELAWDAADRHLAATLEVIERCACTDGCPSCVQSPKCGNGNQPLDKDAAVALLRTLLDGT